MRLVQALRRSIKGDKEKGAIAPKSAVAIVPPKKVGPSSPPRISYLCPTIYANIECLARFPMTLSHIQPRHDPPRQPQTH